MQKVIHPARPGQGTIPSCVCAPLQPCIQPEPAQSEPWQMEEEGGELGVFSPPEAPKSLLQQQALPHLQPLSYFAVSPRPDEGEQDIIIRSLSRRAARDVRPRIQSSPEDELWVVGFDERCRQLGTKRLVPGPQGQSYATVTMTLSWAEAEGARAIVLVQNQRGSRTAATPVDLVPTLQLACIGRLLGILLVDHVIIHGTGTSTHLRQWSVLAEARMQATCLQASLEDLASTHRHFGLPRPPNPPATLP